MRSAEESLGAKAYQATVECVRRSHERTKMT